MPLVIGGVLSYFAHRKVSRMHTQKTIDHTAYVCAHHRGILQASGIVAGSTIMGVVLAIPFALEKSSDVLRIMPAHLGWLTDTLGIIAIVALCVWMYRTVAIQRKGN